MSHGLLGILKCPVPVCQGDQEEGAPEEEVGQGDHQEHPHPGSALPPHLGQVQLHLQGQGGAGAG